jgi:nucleoside-diphosphate-sugar epimerase
MNLLVIGGTGFISSRLVSMLADAGHDVTVVTRGVSGRATPDGVRSIRADRHDVRAIGRAIGGGTFDAVYDMIAYTPDESMAALSLFADRTPRLVHCSTISVYMVSNEARCPVTEDQDRLPLMEHWPDNPFGMDYGIHKRACEDVLWAAHDRGDVQVTMLRPTFVGGPGDPMRRDWFWIQRILDGGPLLVPGSGDHAFQQVFVDDVARAFARVLDVPESRGRAYNVASEDIQSLREYLHRLAAQLDRKVEIVPVDQDAFYRLPLSRVSGADTFPFNIRRTAVFDLSRIRSELGWRSTPFEEWMAPTVDWFTKADRPSVGYANRDAEIRIARAWSARLREAVSGFDREEPDR